MPSETLHLSSLASYEFVQYSGIRRHARLRDISIISPFVSGMLQSATLIGCMSDS
jgi:hypothetical protein